jgi:hypothetical protein
MVPDGRHNNRMPISLLLVEGETEELFYGRVKQDFLGGCRVTIRCLKGLYNINRNVIDRITEFIAVLIVSPATNRHQV